MKTLDLDLRDGSLYNAFINGNFDFWQRGTTVTRTSAGSSGYLSDRVLSGVGTGVSKSITLNRSTTVPSGLLVPAQYSYEIVNNTAVASFPASENIEPFLSKIEGTIFQPLMGKDFTVGFWLFTSFAGSVPVSIKNGAGTFSYVTMVTVSVGWQYVSLVIPWNSNITEIGTAAAMTVDIAFIGGTSYNAPSLNAWNSGSFYSHSTATNWAATAGAIIRIAQIQIRSGQWAKDDLQNTFQRTGMDYASELRLCQRYCEVITSGQGILGYNPLGTTASASIPIQWKVTKRAVPTMQVGTGAVQQVGIDGVTVFQGSIGALGFYNPTPVTGDADIY